MVCFLDVNKILLPSQLSFKNRSQFLVPPGLALVLYKCYHAQSGQPFLPLLPLCSFTARNSDTYQWLLH